MPMITAPTPRRVSRRARWAAAVSLVALVAAVIIAVVIAWQSTPATATDDPAPFSLTFLDSFRGSDATPLVAPMGVAVGMGQVFVADPRAGEVAVFGMAGDPQGALRDEALTEPIGVSVDSASDTIWVADRGSRSVLAFDADGSFRTVFMPADGIAGRADELAMWRPVAVDASGGRLYVADIAGGRVVAFDAEGRWVAEYGAQGRTEDGRLSYPVAVQVEADEVFVADGNNRRLAIFAEDSGAFLRTIALPGVPRGLAVVADGSRVLVSDATSSEGRVLDARTGTPVAVFGAHGIPASRLARPHGLASLGDRLFVVDSDTARVGVWRWKNRAASQNATLDGQRDGRL